MPAPRNKLGKLLNIMPSDQSIDWMASNYRAMDKAVKPFDYGFVDEGINDPDTMPFNPDDPSSYEHQLGEGILGLNTGNETKGYLQDHAARLAGVAGGAPGITRDAAQWILRAMELSKHYSNNGRGSEKLTNKIKNALQGQ